MNSPLNQSQAKHPPLISVVTCTYNSDTFLEKSLLSVETQSYRHIEHVINDSFSTDRTMPIIEKYIMRNQKKYPIILIQTDPLGIGNALNRATEVAGGEIIHYLHSDDYYICPDSLAKAASYFSNHPNLTWLTGNFLVENKGRQIIIPHSHLLKFIPATAISITNFIHHENTFVKREAILQYGGFCEDKTMNVEYRLWLRMIQDHKPLVVNDQFAVFIIHNKSTSTGNLIQFSKALLRGCNTLRREKVLPLIGYYENVRVLSNTINYLQHSIQTIYFYLRRLGAKFMLK